MRREHLNRVRRRLLTTMRLRRARAGLVSKSFDSRLLWIFGSPRSGSTWLLHLFAEHRAVVSVNEPLIGLLLGPLLSELSADPDNLDHSNFTLTRLNRGHEANVFGDAYRDIWTPALGRLLRARFYAHAARFPPRAGFSRAVVAIKEPNGSQSADLIMSALPRARFLFLLRDGRDVVDSEWAGAVEGGWVSGIFPGVRGVSQDDRLNFVRNSAYRWLWRTEVVQQAFAAHTGPKHMVRYEDLLVDTGGELRALFDWLGLAVSTRELNEWIRKHSFGEIPEDARGPDKFFRAATPGLWRTNLSEDEKELVVGVIGEKLRELGYQT